MSRLCSATAVAALKQFLGQHLGAQFSSRIQAKRRFSEAEKLEFVPLIFGLLPRKAAIRDSVYVEVKPAIREHLERVGVPCDDLILDIVKVLCDNFDRSKPSDPGSGRIRPRKFGLADLKQRPTVYNSIRRSQGGRCAVCGVQFLGDAVETLDHVVPWRLGGDPPDGSNWQLLCKPCNEAKGNLISSLVMLESHNWVYSDTNKPSAEYLDQAISSRSRFLALATFAKCQHAACGAGPSNTELFVVKTVPSGFSVFDHLSVYCEPHAAIYGLKLQFP
jgi:5-methylcytosine-specific restriction endonuclease McrA